jgi:hypothetical protein
MVLRPEELDDFVGSGAFSMRDIIHSHVVVGYE